MGTVTVDETMLLQDVELFIEPVEIYNSKGKLVGVFVPANLERAKQLHAQATALLEPEEVKRFSLQKPLKLTFGNAGGVKLSVNGKPMTAIGRSGEVQSLEIDSTTYQRYLAVAQ